MAALPASLPQERPWIVAAPIAEFSNGAARATAFAYGADLCYTEMVSAAGMVHDSRNTVALLERLPAETGPVFAQLYGNKPDEMAEAAKRIAAMGRFEGLDLNAGCPAPKVLRCGGGARLMDDPALFSRLVESLVRATDLPVTVKTRIGRTPEEAPLAAELARRAEDAGAAAITLHARVLSRMHSGDPDWRAVRAAVDAVKIPVIVNGGIASAATARTALEESGARGVMLARAALGNPFLFAELRRAFESAAPLPAPDAEARLAALRAHIDRERELREAIAARSPELPLAPETAVLIAFRTHLFLYLKGLPGAAAVRRRLNEISTLAELEKIINGFDVKL